MSAAIPFKLTVAGQDAAFNLGAIDLNVTYVQLGSGNRLANGNETALVTPQESVAISGHFEVSVGQHRIAAVVPGSVSAYQVSEIGLWSGVPGAGGSVLVFYWSLATGYIAHKDAGIDFNFESDILFGGVVPGNITIVADTQFNSLAMLAEHESDPGAHPIIDTPPLGDNDQSPVNSEWVQQTIGKVLSKSVAGSADVTLTAVEAGHGILKLTGVLTGNIAVIVPDSPTREWLVINSTTGNYALTVKTAAGTGAIAVRGIISHLLCDGVNVVNSVSGVVQSGAHVSATAGGTANALTGAYSPAIAVLGEGMVLHLKGVALNTVSNPTFTPNPGTIAAATIVKGNDDALLDGDLDGHAILKWESSLGKWVLLNPAYGVHPPLGYGMTKTDESANRSPVGIVYTNTSESPIIVSFNGIASTAGQKILLTAGSMQYIAGVQSAGEYVGIWGIVEPGEDYNITLTAGTFSPGWTWFEASY